MLVHRDTHIRLFLELLSYIVKKCKQPSDLGQENRSIIAEDHATVKTDELQPHAITWSNLSYPLFNNEQN